MIIKTQPSKDYLTLIIREKKLINKIIEEEKSDVKVSRRPNVSVQMNHHQG